MVGLWPGDNALCTSKLDSGLKDRFLMCGDGLNEAEFVEMAYNRCHPVIAQTSGMNWGWNKVVAQGIHLGDGTHPRCITKVIGIDSSGQARAGLWLDTNDS